MGIPSQNNRFPTRMKHLQQVIVTLCHIHTILKKNRKKRQEAQVSFKEIPQGLEMVTVGLETGGFGIPPRGLWKGLLDCYFLSRNLLYKSKPPGKQATRWDIQYHWSFNMFFLKCLLHLDAFGNPFSFSDIQVTLNPPWHRSSLRWTFVPGKVHVHL